MLRIGLYNLEPQIVNSAMMQVSQYHKQQGDQIEMYHPLMHDTYSKIYAFSLFDFTDKSYVLQDMICGGTGFDLTAKLPKEIENCDYDWSIYPDCDYSIVWFSRGCIRSCPFCVVRQKEGWIRPVEPKNLNPNGQHIKVMDNNFFANPQWEVAVDQLIEWDMPVDFQGVDARILRPEMISALNRIKRYGQIHIAWDNPKDDLEPKLKEITRYIKPYKLMCYVLIGYWSTEEEDIHRIETLRKLKIDPFVMPYNKSDTYQNDFARYVNRKEIFNACTWQEYKDKKGYYR